MCHQKRNVLGLWLPIAAWSGLGLGIVGAAEEPPARGRSGVVAPGTGGERFLLLTDGRLIPGVIAHDEAGYTVTQKLGVIRFPKRMVERAFGSVEEAYRYRLERAPEEDPAERLRLARWCLSMHLDKEARALLEQVLEISPDHGPAKAMLTSMAQTEASRLARKESKVDEGVRQTGGEEVHEDRPMALDSAVLRGAEYRMGITGLPVIFDLPPAMAVRRAEQFKQYVHPVLQAYCAKCHNPEYPGMFQLVPVKSNRDRTPDALRANLDATLRLIDLQRPEKSELLASTLRPHGVGGKGRPIFSGSNDRAYRILATWVTSLRPQPSGEEVAARRPAEDGESFAADRARSGGEPLDEFARRTRGEGMRPSPMMRPAAGSPGGGRGYRYVEGQGMVPEDLNATDPREFPLPPMLGGSMPTVPGRPAARGGARGGLPAPRGGMDPLPPLPSAGDPGPTAAGADPVGPRAPTTPAAGSGPPTAKKKPVKLDPRILEKLLQKNTGRSAGQ